MSLSPSGILYEEEHIGDNRGPEIMASSIVFVALAVIAMGLRLLARRVSKAGVKYDDYMIIFALVAAVLYAVHLGAGKHVILLQDLPAYAKFRQSFPSKYYCVGTAAFKFSALLMFHRIFGSARQFTVFVWVTAFFVGGNNFAGIFHSIYQCNPINKAWHLEVEGTCVDILLSTCILGAINVLCDLVTVLLPLPLIWNLHMDRSCKLQLAGIFLLSGFVCIASAYRTYVVKELSHGDATWADVDPMIWALVENAIGIVSTSLPTMRPIYCLVVRGHYCSSRDTYCNSCLSRLQTQSNGSAPFGSMPWTTKQVSRATTGSAISHESLMAMTAMEKEVPATRIESV